MSIPRKARETALRMLFQWEMTRETPAAVQDSYWKHAKTEPPVRELGDQLFEDVVERVELIDPLIREHSEHWSLERMSAVDRNILRIAICEFFTRPDVASTIVITEAMEVARRYSTEQSAHFINAVLDAVRRKLRADEKKPG